MGAGGVRDWPRGGRGTLRASPGGSGFSGSGEGAAAEAAPAAGGGAAAFCFPLLCWEVPAPRPERPASRPEWEEAGSSPRTPGQGKGPDPGKRPRKGALTSIFQTVAELAALADPQLLPLLGMQRFLCWGAQRTRGGGQGRVAPRRWRDCGARRAAALAARGRLHGAGQQIAAATTSTTETRVRSARRCGSQRAKGRTDSAEREGVRARRSGGARAAGGAGVSRSRATRAAGGRGWGRTVAAALRLRGQVRASGTRPEAPAPEPEQGNQCGGRDPVGSDARRLPETTGDAGRLGQGLVRVREETCPTHAARWFPEGNPLESDFLCRPGSQRRHSSKRADSALIWHLSPLELARL